MFNLSAILPVTNSYLCWPFKSNSARMTRYLRHYPPSYLVNQSRVTENHKRLIKLKSVKFECMRYNSNEHIYDMTQLNVVFLNVLCPPFSFEGVCFAVIQSR